MKAVIGLGFGDEGKGTVVAFLSSQNPLATVPAQGAVGATAPAAKPPLSSFAR